MNIIIVGGGASGIFAACLIKKTHPEYNITILEKNDKINKKLYATGNGRCNLGNTRNVDEKYSNSLFVGKILNKHNINIEREFFRSLGIETISENGYIYPYSRSAKTFIGILDAYISDKNIKIVKNCKVIDYKASENIVEVTTDNGVFKGDKVIFATGGKSSPKFGSDGSLIDVYKKHGYDIKTIKPALCPIKIIENVKDIEGVRVDAHVYLTQNDKVVHDEDGEVLFKKDGLSGIVIMNISSFIARFDDIKNVKIYLDLLPEISLSDLTTSLYKYKDDLKNPLESYFPKILAEHIYNIAKPQLNSKESYFKLAKIVKNCIFTFKDLYSFEDSQVSVGGISFTDVNEALKSTLESNVYFIGEVLDTDGLCGGYNLMWCFASAKTVVEDIN